MLIIIAAALGLMLLERIIPDQHLPNAPGWWGRVLALNLLQYGVVTLAGGTWDSYFQRASLLSGSSWHPVVGVALGYVLITFVFYFWHRARHQSRWLWNALHQVHHSPVRIETITSFYKHPLEILVNSLLISALVYGVLGLSVAGGQAVLVVTAIAEFLYHMNIRTPRVWGLLFQRPEMHRIHHQRGVHTSNFADLPLWDMLFATYRNPDRFEGECGFQPPREQQLWDMLRMRNVNAAKERR